MERANGFIASVPIGAIDEAHGVSSGGVGAEPEEATRSCGDICRKDFGLSTASDAGEGERAESAPRALSAMASEGFVSTCGNSFCLRAISSLSFSRRW